MMVQVNSAMAGIHTFMLQAQQTNKQILKLLQRSKDAPQDLPVNHPGQSTQLVVMIDSLTDTEVHSGLSGMAHQNTTVHPAIRHGAPPRICLAQSTALNHSLNFLEPPS